MTKRIYQFNARLGRFNTPISYYGAVYRNNGGLTGGATGNKRIRKKAADIMNDIQKGDGGWEIMQKSLRDELTFDEWLKHVREKASKRNVGNNKRWHHMHNLRTAFRLYVEANKMANYTHDYN